MAMAAVYTTVNGMLVHESRGGVESFYFPDTLGNLTTVRSSTGVKTYGAEYWPYGEIQTETGTNPSPWSFVGLLGYLRDTASRLYVRARHYRPGLARWQTVDPLWPSESAYGYASGQPTTLSDPSGLAVAQCIVIGSTIGTAIAPGIGTVVGAIVAVVVVGLVIYLCTTYVPPSTTAPECKPDCSAEVSLKQFACNMIPHGCTQSDTCRSATLKIAAGLTCLAAKINVDRCFGGVNYSGKDHTGSQQQTRNAIANCINVAAKKCKKKRHV